MLETQTVIRIKTFGFGIEQMDATELIRLIRTLITANKFEKKPLWLDRNGVFVIGYGDWGCLEAFKNGRIDGQKSALGSSLLFVWGRVWLLRCLLCSGLDRNLLKFEKDG